jgi:hypothetical protein
MEEQTTPNAEQQTEQSNQTNAGSGAADTSFENQFLNNIQSKYPDYDRERVFEHATNRYQDLKEGYNDLKGNVTNLYEAMRQNPKIAIFVAELVQNPDNFAYAVRAALSKEDLQQIADNYDVAEEDPDREQSLNSYRESRQKQAEFSQNFDKNYKTSLDNIEKIAKEKGYLNEDGTLKDESFIQKLEPLFNVMSGDISEDLVELLLKGYNFDEAVQKAEAENYEQGVTEGKNSKIEQTRLQKEKSTDGLPVPTPAIEPQKKQKNFINLKRASYNNN